VLNGIGGIGFYCRGKEGGDTFPDTSQAKGNSEEVFLLNKKTQREGKDNEKAAITS